MIETIGNITDWLNTPLLTLGDASITAWKLIYMTAVLALLMFLTSRLNRLVIYRLMSKSSIEVGTRVAVATLIRYVIITIGFFIVLQAAGIDITSLTIIFGALGIGIGFGLQNITNNFVSGLIILFERPIKVGDRIEVAGITGDVISISMRATTILTNDNISIIVPNSEFISSKVINWSHAGRNVRFNFPVSISYREDPEKVREILLGVARENGGVLKSPSPDVLFNEFSESSVTLTLRVWTREYTDRPGVLKSQLYYAVSKRFRELGIEIPYPQRDIHIIDVPDAGKKMEGVESRGTASGNGERNEKKHE